MKPYKLTLSKMYRAFRPKLDIFVEDAGSELESKKSGREFIDVLSAINFGNAKVLKSWLKNAGQYMIISSEKELNKLKESSHIDIYNHRNEIVLSIPTSELVW